MLSPWKQCQTQIDNCCVQSVDCIFQGNAKIFVDVKLPCFFDKNLCKIVIYSPVSFLVCIGQVVARDFPTKAAMIKFFVQGSQASFDISETLPVCQLSECHCQILVEA